MNATDSEKVIGGLILDPTTHQRCAPRYDELLVTATYSTESLVTIVYRAIRQGEIRVLQLARDADRWRLASEQIVPVVLQERTRPTRPDYSPRTFHFVPGTEIAPRSVDEDRVQKTNPNRG